MIKTYENIDGWRELPARIEGACGWCPWPASMSPLAKRLKLTFLEVQQTSLLFETSLYNEHTSTSSIQISL